MSIEIIQRRSDVIQIRVADEHNEQQPSRFWSIIKSLTEAGYSKSILLEYHMGLEEASLNSHHYAQDVKELGLDKDIHLAIVCKEDHAEIMGNLMSITKDYTNLQLEVFTNETTAQEWLAQKDFKEVILK